MNVLCIGNSFSRNSSHYLHAICPDITVVNLYIGGCSLDRHFRNMHSGDRAYMLQVNGVDTGFYVSLDEALLNRSWDYVSFQQASHLSNNFEAYEPYLTELSDYVKALCPKARQIIHETWAYEDESDRLINMMGYKTHAEMYADIRLAYEKAAESIDADLVIPSGRLFAELVKNGIKVHIDTFHANRLGECALGLLWCKTLTGGCAVDDPFSDFGDDVSREDIAKIKSIVDSI